MWTALLEYALWYVTFVHPLVIGVQLCRHTREGQLVNARLIANVTLGMIILWLLNVADALVLSHFLLTGKLYTCVRIAVSLYLLHPKYQGATRAYNYFFANGARTYAPLVDELVTRHLAELNHSGVAKYLGSAAGSLLNLVVDLLGVAKQLLVASTDTEHPPASIEHQLSPVEKGQPMSPTLKVCSPQSGGAFYRERINLLDFLKSPEPSVAAAAAAATCQWRSPPLYVDPEAYMAHQCPEEESVLFRRKREYII